MKIVLVTGSRHAQYSHGKTWDLFTREMNKATKDWATSKILVVHGGARGIDALAARWCEQTGIEQRVFQANWSEHGKSAGPMRNHQMVDCVLFHRSRGAEVECLAFPAANTESRGTVNCIVTAKRAGIPTKKMEIIV